jgi:polyisoprenoid-binding protein YceI
MRGKILFPVVATFAMASSTSYAAWHVDNHESTLNFVTAKAAAAGAGGIEEVQSFKQITGTLQDDGALAFNVDLASVETNIPLRNDRLKDLLFKVAKHPEAQFKAAIDVRDLSDVLRSRGVADIELTGQLTIAGQTRPLAASLRVVNVGEKEMLVSTRMPIMVNLEDYGLHDGVEALRVAANLNMVASAAPVSFSLMLREGE